MIEVKDLTKNYGTFPAVKRVSFSIGKGEVVGLLGPNGAGKTTIMKVLTCYHYPDGGTATLNGFDVVREPLAVKRQIGYLPEMAPVYTDLNVYEYLNFIAEARGIGAAERKRRIEETAAECGLSSVLYKEIGNLSKGYRQRTGLAQAIIHKPEILILDEPTTGLDPNQIIEIRNLIQNIGKEKTVLLSTHILQEVEAVCDRVLIVNDGLIVAEGTTEEIGKSLKGEPTLHLVLATAADGVAESLKECAAVTAVRSAEAKNGLTAFTVQLTSEDAAPEVFDWAVKNRCRIAEMYLEKIGLEDIFIRLTHEGV